MSSTGTGQRTYSDMLAAVMTLARRAGERLVVLQSGVLAPRAKSDGSPVTLADREAHEIIAAALPDIGPYLVVSEESEPHEHAERLEHDRVWIVDPLDGTRGYLRGSREFTVNVALVEGGVPILGVVVAPALGVAYCAERGAGAYRLRGDHPPERIACAVSAVGTPRVVVSGSDVDLPWTTLPGLASARVDALSSSVKLGLVADGGAVAYPRLTPSSEWDIAAGHAIVTEAGGRVIGLDGHDLRYNKPDPLNTAFLATGAPAVAARWATILGLADRSGARPRP